MLRMGVGEKGREMRMEVEMGKALKCDDEIGKREALNGRAWNYHRRKGAFQTASMEIEKSQVPCQTVGRLPGKKK